MYAYHFNGYWKDVGTIPSLWEANMEVLDPDHSGINLFDDNWKIYSRNSGMTGHRVGDNAVVENSMITDGCNIKGNVKHSILFSGVTVEEGASTGAAPAAAPAATPAQALMAIWKYDRPPYYLGGEIERILPDGKVVPVGYNDGYCFEPVKILPLDKMKLRELEMMSDEYTRDLRDLGQTYKGKAELLFGI